MPSLRTLIGKIFEYSGSLDNDIVVHKGVDIYISRNIVKIVMNGIARKNPVLMGACRDNTSLNSLGEMLLNQGYSPQSVSYVIPLLVENGFCKVNRSKPFIVSKN